ncbi:XylR N-terminal domain-containing protein [Thermoactinomyces mirandus]|uniref:XylR N-terminal domain-containing protein n=1 Tax=Thermoactinomyces mirandus TaxID=2756294 RepID=A0A7W2AT63_9BACL|nr:XylR N-terminal domain-containing protein [Thermoactinomyces mirandus]MBA4603410.1 XylR N-terminal domain-containing protein [Thermoactinomyces mirandus]
MEIQIKDQRYNPKIEKNHRQMITFSTALGILRQQLARNIGEERIKGFLVRFGWEMGVNDAKQALKSGSSLESLIKQGPIIHMNNRHIRGFTHECTVELDDEHNIVSLFGKGTWIDSYEAVEHIKRAGISDKQTCHTLIGYSSGFMSTICGQPVLAKEVKCIGKGDPECSWITRTKKDWESGMYEELHFYYETPIREELKYTYEQLLERQTFVTRLSDFQTKLTEEILNGSDLQTIVDMVYDMIQIPVMIEDMNFETITYAGLSEKSCLNLKADMDQYIQKEKHYLPFRKKTIKTANQERLITPIIVQKEVLGYCSFIYNDEKKHKPEEDYLLLDRFANAASLVLLNEKTRFESFERMKGNFLEQILGAQLPVKDIISRGKFAGLDLRKPYHIMVMKYRKTQLAELSVEEEFLLQEQILETAFRFFNRKKYPVLVGQREGNIILLMTKESNEKLMIPDIIKNFQNELKQKYPGVDFMTGISNQGDRIENASRHYEEASIALRLTMKKKIAEFHSLGIIGVLINSKNTSGIKMMAEEELGPLYNQKDPRSVELLKTLYIYLKNGGKLKQTMDDLKLSMSGLRHRIKRIEGLLEKDLRDSNEMNQLFLIIKSLVALGEIDFI